MQKIEIKDFESIKDFSEAEIESLLAKVELRELVYALKGASPFVKDNIFKYIPDDMQTWFGEENQKLGSVKLLVVEKYQEIVLEKIKD